MASRLTAVLVILFCSRLAMSQDLPVNADALEIRNWPPVLISGTGQLGIAVVLYQELPAMLLNEVQKQQRKIEEQEKAIELLQKRLESLETRRSDSSGC